MIRFMLMFSLFLFLVLCGTLNRDGFYAKLPHHGNKLQKHFGCSCCIVDRPMMIRQIDLKMLANRIQLMVWKIVQQVSG